MQLKEQAQALKEMDLTVCVVQVPQVEQNTLDTWMEENDIPFPAGMIQGENEALLRQWGVQSMPWLMLTEAKQVVCAEGFGLAELDNRLSQVSAAGNAP